jgi:arylsulfatase A-like enzyme
MQVLLDFILLCPFVLSAVAAPQPNIIYILCDELGYGDVGVFVQNQCAARQDRSAPFLTATDKPTHALLAEPKD